MATSSHLAVLNTHPLVCVIKLPFSQSGYKEMKYKKNKRNAMVIHSKYTTDYPTLISSTKVHRAYKYWVTPIQTGNTVCNTKPKWQSTDKDRCEWAQVVRKQREGVEQGDRVRNFLHDHPNLSFPPATLILHPRLRCQQGREDTKAVQRNTAEYEPI